MRPPSYRFGIVLAFVLQVGLLGWIVSDRALLLQNGKEIRLAVVPVDPHDLFRGDYVALSYAISRLRNNTVAGDDVFALQDAIYVTLTQDGSGVWAASAISHAQPTNGPFLKGIVFEVTDESGTCDGADKCQTYAITYNLEKFFVPEGTGRALEALRNDQHVSVDVAVAADGRAALKRLLVDGEPRYSEGLY
jgi:uncharacterized membrane-anchored protein